MIVCNVLRGFNKFSILSVMRGFIRLKNLLSIKRLCLLWYQIDDIFSPIDC